MANWGKITGKPGKVDDRRQLGKASIHPGHKIKAVGAFRSGTLKPHSTGTNYSAQSTAEVPGTKPLLRPDLRPAKKVLRPKAPRGVQ